MVEFCFPGALPCFQVPLHGLPFRHHHVHLHSLATLSCSPAWGVRQFDIILFTCVLIDLILFTCLQGPPVRHHHVHPRIYPPDNVHLLVWSACLTLSCLPVWLSTLSCSPAWMVHPFDIVILEFYMCFHLFPRPPFPFFSCFFLALISFSFLRVKI